MNQHTTARCCAALHGAARHCTLNIGISLEHNHGWKLRRDEDPGLSTRLLKTSRGLRKQTMDMIGGILEAGMNLLGGMFLHRDTPTLPRQARHATAFSRGPFHCLARFLRTQGEDTSLTAHASASATSKASGTGGRKKRPYSNIDEQKENNRPGGEIQSKIQGAGKSGAEETDSDRPDSDSEYQAEMAVKLAQKKSTSKPAWA
ncbi:hypothetical protein B0H16DRAFT_1455059 [Mycena metata]|uniref:Uncharacterized protein n=1 Tax=Mycena metata TaxID=1033252 RepID=A0AAD7JFM8_9AGAR|nr:hypothetical protein B0H16DRAFT_1455059 [Mycena metata]